MVFQFDSTADGRRLKFLNVIYKHSRFCLAIRDGRRCKAKDVVAVLEELTSLYPAPAYFRSHNDPGFIVQALRDWCEASDTTSTAYIEPGSPRENGFADSFNERFRDEFLNTELFTTAPEAQLLADRCAGSTARSGRTRPSRVIRPWRQLNRELPYDNDHPLS
jgi:putative transposase